WTPGVAEEGERWAEGELFLAFQNRAFWRPGLAVPLLLGKRDEPVFVYIPRTKTLCQTASNCTAIRHPDSIVTGERVSEREEYHGLFAFIKPLASVSSFL